MTLKGNVTHTPRHPSSKMDAINNLRFVLSDNFLCRQTHTYAHIYAHCLPLQKVEREPLLQLFHFAVLWTHFHARVYGHVCLLVGHRLSLLILLTPSLPGNYGISRVCHQPCSVPPHMCVRAFLPVFLQTRFPERERRMLARDL